MTVADRLLTVQEVAERLGTTVRFPRRLIEERRITFVKIGRHVRVPESAVAVFIEDNTVQPVAPLRPLRAVA
ncbi:MULTISPECIES: excisionase family DNA-binding protein [Streptomyces]|uniref:excisionase family DNA-binding protein n=1 Tax=Streptomyces TaxID=1883 RepID=UPI00342EBA6C